MTSKILRSFLHEKFPLELRVELDLLSRRRDLTNKEKQEELILLLKKYNIDNVVQLGAGTNRYAFKIDGWVVKCATDNAGRLDNATEFKMAKKLFPYVIKIYEISSNFTMLVCEYIQPFDSYYEMIQYQDEIKDILKKLSSVYLIGDVGISENNYGNWGIRVGTNNPVCLDFAYVYEIRSSLFICDKCNANAMLVPNKDYTKLYCSNPSCGKEQLFEDIRVKLGNDIHRHQLDKLSEEGYELYESFVLTELTPNRSNYLIKKTNNDMNKNKEEKKLIIPKNDFVMDKPPSEYLNQI